MSVASVTAIIPAIAANAFADITSVGILQSFDPAMDLVVAPGLLLGLFGVPLFGIFGGVILFIFFASAFGSRRIRDHGNPSGLGLVIAFMVLFIIMLVVNVALR